MGIRHRHPFEKLRVWARARQLAVKVHATTGAYPGRELYGLTARTNRAAVSVAANLAEESAHFSQMARGSLMELACLLILAVDLEYLSTEVEVALRLEIESISRQLKALRNTQTAS
jgi:four helix bundle protein